MPRLDRLILSENKIENIPPPSSSAYQSQNIKHIALVSNNIRSWADIDALSAWFPNLLTLNIGSNPIAQGSLSMSSFFSVILIVPTLGTSARPLVISRISTLLSLNSSAVNISYSVAVVLYRRRYRYPLLSAVIPNYSTCLPLPKVALTRRKHESESIRGTGNFARVSGYLSPR